MINHVIVDKFLANHPNIYKNFVHLYDYYGQKYLFIVNYDHQEISLNNVVSIINNIKTDNNFVQNCCEAFVNYPAVLDVMTKCYLLRGKNITPQMLIEEYKKFSLDKVQNTKLYKHNVIKAYMVDDSGEIGDNSVFNMDFDIQTIRHKGQNTKRIFINNVESLDRGKGLYSELLNNYLPKLCIQNDINWIVLKAVAFDTNSAEKGGQQNLENFYKKLLFQKTNENENFLSEVICEKDFQDGLPLYCKNVQFQYSMQKNNYNEREFV